MSWSTRDLMTGLAEHLGQSGLVDWRPPPAVYAAPYSGPVAVFEQLPDGPDRAVAISVYLGPVSQGGLSDVLVGVQLLWRGPDVDSVRDDADAVYTALDGARHVTLGQDGRLVHTSLIERTSSAPLGLDDSGRRLRSDNYLITASRSTAWRPD